MSHAHAAGIRARLFDADHPDQRLTDGEEVLGARLTERQLLWIDAEGNLGREDAERLAKRFGLQRRTRASLEAQGDAPMVAVHGDYLHVRVAADPSDENPAETKWLDIIAGPNVVITQHQAEIPFLDDLDERIQEDAAAGELSSLAFLTAIIDAAITSYHAAVDRIEEDVDRLDARSLRASARDSLLTDLVRCRRRIARLRQLLADHRSIFTALQSPEMARPGAEDDSAAMLQGLGSRFEGAIGAVEVARDALLGSFDVYMSRMAQRTNDVMKVLTIATVLLLPGSVIAGLLGMNVVVPLNKDDPTSFWLVIAGVAVLAVVALVFARIRHWI